MRGWLGRHLNPPTVIAVIALCVAVGGGYALAFSGSGSLERAKENGIDDAAFENVATLTGIGKLQASCEGNGSPILLRFKNTSNIKLVSRAFGENAGEYTASSANRSGGITSTVSVGVGAETVHWVLSPASERNDPHADMSVTVTPSIVGMSSCEQAEVAAIATTTEQ
jgi:hypothetical protein